MKIAVTAQGKTLTDPVDPRFGRAKYFIIIDPDTGAFEVKDNQAGVDAAQGAGIQAAEAMSAAGVQAVLTGHCGPKAFRALSAAGIKVYIGVEGTVQEAVEKFKAGSLKPATKADVQGHWW
ncbi:MAG: NifB/NifX family molybdenum-iron cluster-binding protein [candidate division WOR-3 bacterium]